MSGATSEQRTGGLVEGSVGPFYIAFSHATFYLLAGIFATIAPLLIYVIRDSSASVQVVVAAGVAMETGALVHIYLERIRDIHKAESWGAHAIISAIVFALILGVRSIA